MTTFFLALSWTILGVPIESLFVMAVVLFVAFKICRRIDRATNVPITLERNRFR